jgi:hypothetical protein
MITISEDHRYPPYLAPGMRVQLRNAMLEAFYGRYGTVLRVHRCGEDGCKTYINVQMDEVPAGEGYATFYPQDLEVLPASALWTTDDM